MARGLSIHSPIKAASLEREVKAMELRKRGFTFREIGALLKDEKYPNGISGKSAFKLVQRAFKRLAAQSTEETADYRNLSLERLDVMRKGLYDEAANGNVQAVMAMLKIEERFARITGLDQPVKVEQKATIETAVTDEQLQRMAALIVDGKDKQ